MSITIPAIVLSAIESALSRETSACLKAVNPARYLPLIADQVPPPQLSSSEYRVEKKLQVMRGAERPFATWRFHLRGETIRGAADVGWLRELTVRRMMRPDVRSVPAHTTVSRFRMVFPLGSTSRVVAVNEEKDYAGIVNVAEAHAVELDESTFIRDILHYPETTLLPTMTVKEAVTIFENSEAEALAVIHSSEKRRVIGLLAESHALRLIWIVSCVRLSARTPRWSRSSLIPVNESFWCPCIRPLARRFWDSHA